MKRNCQFVFFLLFTLPNLAWCQSNAITVFEAGEAGYQCFRIPAIIKAANGDVLAFAEGRKNGCSDTGDIDLVMKRSKDSGLTWSEVTVVWDDSLNTCGNPAPVLDRNTQDILLLGTWNLGVDKESQIIDQTSKDTRHVYLMTSKDHGGSWLLKEITTDVKQSNWTWYATGPGSGIQLEYGPFKDRLIIACDHIEASTKHYYSHIIFSDDGGQTWSLGGSTPLDQVNECEVAELDDGQLLLNMRNYDREKEFRQIAFSSDGGLSWVDQQHDDQLIEPICQASLLRIGQNLYFSNPRSRTDRRNMTIQISSNWGKEWNQFIVLYKGPAAYSDLVAISETELGCLYECGKDHPYERIVFQVIPIQN